MNKLNKVVTESISGVNVLVSYDDQTQTFKVVDKEKEDVLIEGDEIHVCTFLEVNGARIFAPRFMANYPIEKMNANNADMSHMTPFSLLEFLRLRKGVDGALELTIYPRDMQEGAKFVPGIKIPLGECMIEDMKRSSLIGLMLTMKESFKDLKKVVVRTFRECDERQVAFATENGKYFPIVIEPKDDDSFANSVVLILGNSDVELESDTLKNALKTPQTMTVISRDPTESSEVDSIQECFSLDDLIDSHIVVFESSDLNALSNTMFHVHPEATARKWKVSEIKEDVDHNLFYFEVQGNRTDELLSDDFVMGRLLSENVYITHRTPLHESSPMDRAVFALMNGMSLTEAVKNMVDEQVKLDKLSKQMKECDCGGVCADGLSTVATVTASPIAVSTVSCCDTSKGMTSADIHGIAGKVLAPMKKQHKKKNEKDVIKVNDDLRATILREMGIEDQYNKIMNIKQGLKEDDEAFPTDASGSDDAGVGSDLATELANDMASVSDSSSPVDFSFPGDSSDKQEDEQGEKSEEDKIDSDVAIVTQISEDDSSKVGLEYSDGSVTEESFDNLVVAGSVKNTDEMNS